MTHKEARRRWLAVAALAVGLAFAIFAMTSQWRAPQTPREQTPGIDSPDPIATVDEGSMNLAVAKSKIVSRTGGPEHPAGAEDAPAPEQAGKDWHRNWASLQVQADRGDLRAACKLRRVLQRCAFGGVMRADVDASLNAILQGSRATEGELLAREDAASAILERCQEIPAELHRRAWEYALQSALGGSAEEMVEFVLSPPLDLEDPLRYASGIAAYQQHASTLIDRLVAQGSIEGAALAFRRAQGLPFLGASPLAAADDYAIVMYATALQQSEATFRVPRYTTVLQAAELTLDPAAAQGATAAGIALGARLQRASQHDDLDPTANPRACND